MKPILQFAKAKEPVKLEYSDGMVSKQSRTRLGGWYLPALTPYRFF